MFKIKEFLLVIFILDELIFQYYSSVNKCDPVHIYL
jgi:hypothetical protein